MTNLELAINNHLDTLFQQHGSLGCPMQCFTIKDGIAWFKFKEPLARVQSMKAFKSVAIIVLSDFPVIKTVETVEFSYSRSQLESDLLMARLKVGV